MENITLQEPLTLLLAIYSITMLSIAFRSKRNAKTNITIKDYPPVSVIIAFHNEAANLEYLVESLTKQDYPSEFIEYILVDDQSSDHSYQLLNDLKTQLKSDVKLLKTSTNQTGKKAALAIGIDSAKNDILLFTDADCVADQNWISSTINCYQNPSIDAVIGMAPLISESKSLVSMFSTAETFFNHIIAYVSWNWGKPVMSFGRNFSYKKSIFTKIGGFEKIKKSISGDDDLLLEQLRKNKSQISFNLKTRVYSYAESTLSGFIQQKTRHISAARFFDPIYQVIAGLFHLLHICLMIWLLAELSLLFIGIKILIDLFVFWQFQQIFKFNSFFRVFILWELFYWIYILFLGSKGYLTKIRLLKWN